MRVPVIPLFAAFALIVGMGVGPVAIAQDDPLILDGVDWRAEFNKNVLERNHWRWTLRRVERVGDKLTVSLRYRNSASTGRPILLEDQYLQTITLVDEQTQAQFALLEVAGVSPQITAVDRKKSKSAVFTFVYPEGASTVRFTSRWISMRMGGEASVMQVDFRIDIPPANAKPS